MRFFLLLAMMVFSFLGMAQKRVLVTDKVEAKDSIRLRGKSVAEISRDSQFLSPTHYRIPTQKAVRDFVNSAIGNVDVDSLVKAATASGFLTPNSIPYVNGQGRLDARGFEEFGALGSAPSAPSAGFRFFADASGRPSWRRADGFTRTFDVSTITANRVYTLQDKSYTIAGLDDISSLSTVYFPLVGGTLTGTGGSGFLGLPHQTSTPSTPIGGVRIYGNGSSLSWIASDGYERQLASTNTGGRTYTLPNESGTFGLLQRTQSWTGTNTFTQNTTFSNNIIVGAAFPYTFTNPSGTTLTISSTAGGAAGILLNGSSINVSLSGGYPEYRLNGRIFLKEEDVTVASIGRGYSIIRFYPGNVLTSSSLQVSVSNVDISPPSGTSGSAFTISKTNQYSIPFPKQTNSQIGSLTGLTPGGGVFSTTANRLFIHNGTGFLGVAYYNDVKRDTSYKVVNANLDLSAQTTFFKNNYHTVRITTVVTAAATGNNVITMPVPSVDLLGISFKIAVEDTSGDGDISQVSFGVDGSSDGYSYNGDGTYQSSFNLFPGVGVYLSVAWCEAKSAYRWVLQ